MRIVINLVLISINAMTEAFPSDSGIYLNGNQTCTLRLELKLPDGTGQTITTSRFNFSNVRWPVTETGVHRGHLNSYFADIFINDVKKALYVYKDPPSTPYLISYCFFNVEIPGVPLIFKKPLKPRNTNSTLTHGRDKPLTTQQPTTSTSPPSSDYLLNTSPVTVPTYREAINSHDHPPPPPTYGNLSAWMWVAIGAAVSGNLFCIVILFFMTLHYRKRVKEFESKEIPANIRNRPPLPLPPEVIYDAVYSHRRNRFRKWKPRYIPVEERTASAI